MYKQAQLHLTTRLFAFFPFLKDDMICAACKKDLKKRYTKCNMQFVVYDWLFYTQ